MQPLLGKKGFCFYTYPGKLPDFSDHVRLSVDGKLLTKKDAARPILLLDATWRKVNPMNRLFAHVEARSLPELKSAYPYVGKFYRRPDGGLSSIEALAAAFFILGRENWEILLEDYYWKEEFLELNKGFFNSG